MIAQKPDLVLVDRNDVPKLAIVIDNRKNLTADKAVEFRHEVLPELGGAYTPFFMLVSQDTAHIWSQNDQTELTVDPTEQFPMPAVLQNYYSGKINGERLSPGMLNLLVGRWLENLVLAGLDSAPFLPATLQPLIKMAAGGRVRREAEH
jgi:hypothetical protein